MAPVIKALETSPRLDGQVVLTGQHRAMLEQVTIAFGIAGQVDLDIFAHGQSPAVAAAKTIERLGRVLSQDSPAAIVVQGDTTSAAAAAMAGFSSGVPVVHLEAGLRTDNLFNPFPEEGNRRLIGAIASLHLAATPANRDNLLRSGVDPAHVAVIGNTVIDALNAAVGFDHKISDAKVASKVAEGGRMALVTCHRRESWGEPMARVASALKELASANPELTLVFPLHANPTVRDIFIPVLSGAPNIILTEPMDYLDLVQVLQASYLVLSDSGGIQEEAPALGKPVLVLRDNTERPEGITAGTARLVGTEPDRILTAANQLLHDQLAYTKMAKAVNPYGDGMAAQRAEAAIAEMLGVGTRLADFAPLVKE